jgi:hypothetical protein
MHRLDIIAMDAALTATRDYLIQAKATPFLAKLADIEESVDRQSLDLRGGVETTLSWTELDTLRCDIGLEPSLKPSNKR